MAGIGLIKPVFAYWMIALGFKLFGFTEFGASFFPFSFMVFLGLYLGDLGAAGNSTGKSGILQWCLSAHDASIFYHFEVGPYRWHALPIFEWSPSFLLLGYSTAAEKVLLRDVCLRSPSHPHQGPYRFFAFLA